MSGPDFFQTRTGQKFYEATVPAIARALEGIHEELIRQNDLKETEIYGCKLTEEEPEPEPEPEIDYERNEKSDLVAIREYLAKHTTHLSPCPSCGAGNAMNNDGRQYICRFCDHIVRRD